MSAGHSRNEEELREEELPSLHPKDVGEYLAVQHMLSSRQKVVVLPHCRRALHKGAASRRRVRNSVVPVMVRQVNCLSDLHAGRSPAI